MTETIIAEKVVSSEGLAYWLKDPFFILALLIAASVVFLVWYLIKYLDAKEVRHSANMEAKEIRHTTELKEQRADYLANMKDLTGTFGKSLDRVHLRTDEAIKELHVVKTEQKEQGKTIQDIAKKLKI